MDHERAATPLAATKDESTVSVDGRRAAPKIAGVALRWAVSQVDERGEITEILNPAWGMDSAPIVYVYQSIVRPRRIKGWVVHRQQDDRLFVSLGFARLVLYDARPDSPSRGSIDEICMSERNRGLLSIPRGVFHAVENVGEVDLLFVNLPTRAYDHADPDKYRLALDTDQIPFRFDTKPGW